VIALRGARLVLADRVVDAGTLFVEGTQIADLSSRLRGADDTRDMTGRVIVPGFIDVHVHGVLGLDTLDAGFPVAAIAARLPRYGVTAFCPTTVACAPAQLAGVLEAVARARETAPSGARVLPAHLESNFINPQFRGAQPLACLRLPPSSAGVGLEGVEQGEYSGLDVLATIEQHAAATAIVTLAPELPGALDLIARLRTRGIRVSLGHSGASYDEAIAGIDAGARHATHLFNRMTPLHHRDPGLAAAVLEREDVEAEIICDGYHVHPAVAGLAIRTKSSSGVVAISDGTAGSGLPVGARAALGGQPITVTAAAATLEDGTLAGSTLTMERAFRVIVERFGCSLVDAARMCSTNPARALNLWRMGELRAGVLADFVVLDSQLDVVETWVDGSCVYSRTSASLSPAGDHAIR